MAQALQFVAIGLAVIAAVIALVALGYARVHSTSSDRNALRALSVEVADLDELVSYQIAQYKKLSARVGMRNRRAQDAETDAAVGGPIGDVAVWKAAMRRKHLSHARPNGEAPTETEEE